MADVRYIEPSARVEAAGQVFSFLEEYGFGLVQSGDNSVRFESGNMFLTVVFKLDNDRVDLSFGPLRGERQAGGVFDSEDLAELAEPPGRLRWRFARARSPELLMSILEGYAGLLRTRAVGLLRGAPAVFEKLSLARKARERRAARQLSRHLAANSIRDDADGEATAHVVVGQRTRHTIYEWSNVLDRAEQEAHALLSLSLDKEQAETWEQKFSMLEPHPLDYERVFKARAASGALKAYLGLWSQIRPAIVPGPGHTGLKVTACLSDWLKSGNALARRFPEGYNKIAGLLEPGVIWIAWKYVGPGKLESLDYDGLVWLDNYFAWFPKPFHILASLVMQ
ncbi:MAG TPA: hypothetical protein VM425_12775 [Myxococcota bacterium]|nr:hypothetical protein [Myxococcota bacterium]